ITTVARAILSLNDLGTFALGFPAGGAPGHSTTESPARLSLLAVIGLRALDTRGNPLHLILAVELHLLQFDFFQEVFRIQVGRLGDLLQFCFVLLVLPCQTLILGVCFEEYVPRCPLRSCHAFLLTTAVNGM